jgi:hypothetical protein
MFKDIIQNAIKEMNADTKIIRLTWLTTFFHSLIVTLLIIININTLFAKNYANGLYVGKVTQYFIEEIAKNHFLSYIITITIVLFLAYSIIYPIGQGAIIYYLHSPKEGMSKALKKGKSNLFPLFEFSFISLVTSPVVIIFLAFKLIIIDGNTSTGVILALILWTIFINIFNSLKAYTRYFITLEKMPLYEAFKASFALGIQEMKNTSKYMRVQTMLLINFSVNLIIIIGIPFGIIYLAIVANIMQYLTIRILVYGIFACMVIGGSYISAIIRAFFVYYWYEIFKIIKNHKHGSF